MSNDATNPTTLLSNEGSSRRWFLGAAAAVTAGGVLAACGKNDEKADTVTTKADTATTAATTATTAAAGASGDLGVAALAAGLEFLAVGTYTAALQAATDKKLGTVPPAVATFATTAKTQHQSALDAWNKVLTTNGKPAVAAAPASLKATVDTEFGTVKDVVGVATLALKLEQIAADTYLGATKALTGKDAITTAGALQSVCQERAAVLLFVLGKYPVPDIFQKTDKAFAG